MMSGYHIKQAHQYQIVQQYPYSTHQQSSQHVNQSLIYLQSNGASGTNSSYLPCHVKNMLSSFILSYIIGCFIVIYMFESTVWIKATNG